MLISAAYQNINCCSAVWLPLQCCCHAARCEENRKRMATTWSTKASQATAKPDEHHTVDSDLRCEGADSCKHEAAVWDHACTLIKRIACWHSMDAKPEDTQNPKFHLAVHKWAQNCSWCSARWTFHQSSSWTRQLSVEHKRQCDFVCF